MSKVKKETNKYHNSHKVVTRRMSYGRKIEECIDCDCTIINPYHEGKINNSEIVESGNIFGQSTNMAINGKSQICS